MEHKFELFCKLPLFKGLTLEHRTSIYNVSSEVILNKGDYLIREGDDSKDVFLLIEGNLAVVKFDQLHNVEHLIANINQGELIGELGALEGIKRTASVKATASTIVRKIPVEKCTILIDSDPHFYRVFHSLSIDLAKRIRTTSETALAGLQIQLEEIKIRTKMATFFINIVVMLCLFSCLLGVLKSLIAQSSSTTFITTIVLSVSFIVSIGTVIKTDIPLEWLGFTTKNLKKSIYESIFFSAIFLVLFVLLKWILICYVPRFHNISLFEVWWPKKESSFFGINFSLQFIQIFSIIMYAFIGCFMQEVIARGGMQGVLSHFLIGKRKAYTAAVFSNIIFSTIHIFVSSTLAVIVFFPGLYFSWLFIRHGNLIGCSIAHIILGTIAIFFIGLPVSF